MLGPIKLFLKSFLSPAGFLGVLILYLIYKLIKNPTSKKIKLFLFSSILALYLLSSEPLASFILKPLENQYQYLIHPETYTNIKHIVVLGGGQLPNEKLSSYSKLSEGSLNRLIETIRLKKIKPECKIIFSGGNTFDSKQTEADIYGLAYTELTNDVDYIKSAKAENTKQEAKDMYVLLADTPFFLVSSASHMPRAIKIFEKTGLKPIACPSDYSVRSDHFTLSPPNSGSLGRSEKAITEIVGRLWFWITD